MTIESSGTGAPATTTTPAPPRRRPIIVTIAIVLAYINGIGNTVLGVAILLSRYDVQGDALVVRVSLLGAAITLLGLLAIAVASGLSRASRFARLLITVYLGVQTALQVYAIIDSDAWDWGAAIQIVLQLLVVAVLWLPPGAAYFRATPSDGAAPAAS